MININWADGTADAKAQRVKAWEWARRGLRNEQLKGQGEVGRSEEEAGLE